jgi:hypothetical protein
MSEYVLFADGRPVFPVTTEQVPELEPLFCLRGIMLLPIGRVMMPLSFSAFLPAASAPPSLQLELF